MFVIYNRKSHTWDRRFQEKTVRVYNFRIPLRAEGHKRDKSWLGLYNKNSFSSSTPKVLIPGSYVYNAVHMTVAAGGINYISNRWSGNTL